ncbi:hypothetical protein BL253_35910 [Pseudofrankia asymbiotica]|uniref:Uncharacterized protein n=1 Tax=Pseudofrankia asymbiotica TaxID=1834516 RepID=A0A1V2I018_9ACTN|nr:hypothetical protein BL253_35910 [Pseudofrankia asymbiotica]
MAEASTFRSVAAVAPNSTDAWRMMAVAFAWVGTPRPARSNASTESRHAATTRSEGEPPSRARRRACHRDSDRTARRPAHTRARNTTSASTATSASSAR